MKKDIMKKNLIKNKLIFILILVVGLVLMAAFSEPKIEAKPKTKTTAIDRSIAAHPSQVTRQELKLLLAQNPDSSDFKLAERKIVSAVLPHHLVAAPLLLEVCTLLAEQKPKCLIVIGPNHENKAAKIISGTYGWQTPDGVLATEEDAVQQLWQKGLAVINEEVLATEHSIGALAPLLKHFVPEAKIIPIILQYGVSLQEVDALLDGLEPFLDGDTVLISSVDFSHYLTRSEAEAKDRVTLAYMNNFDYPALFALDDSYLDSPASLAAAFRLAERRGIRSFTVLGNTNSGRILQNDYLETTSYFTILFTE
jgi:AmmeMemoRadiSam system protein B